MSSLIFFSISVCLLPFFYLGMSISSPETTSIPRTNESDLEVLLQFKDKISSDPFGILSTWNDSTHFCQWQGVTCGLRHMRITRLVLPSLKLAGSLSPYIGNLSFVRLLNIQDNGFTGEIPPEIGKLHRLTFLGLENNSFSGHLPPNISGCTELAILRVGNNMLAGELPSGLGLLSKLEYAFIYGNNFSGNFPEFFGNLSSLQVISGAFNSFVGSVPSSLGNLQQLSYLYLGANQFSGTLPLSIFNMSSLIGIQFPQNQLEGGLPPYLGSTLPNLQGLNLAANHFTGPLPASISNASNLMRITVPFNNFSGDVPTLEKLSQLQWLSISLNQLGQGAQDDLRFLKSVNSTNLQLVAIDGNNFGGTLPVSVGNLSSQLNIMSIEDNQFSGKIPPSIGNLLGLELLYMANNQFTGSLPDSIGNLINLKDFRAQKNKFTGSIPSSVGNLSMLTTVVLRGNNLGGSIPSSLGKCQKLISLDLSQNNLTGKIPIDILTISALSIYFDLSQNQLIGSLPEEIGNLNNLARLDVHQNKLSGKIPGSLGQCTSLVELYMQDNLFQGNVSSSLNSLKGVQYLDLSHNNLSGPIPAFLENLHLLSLNLSFNDFEGEVPTDGVFRNVSGVSLEGNDKLCGGIPILNLQSCPTGKLKHGSSSLRKVIILASCGSAVVISMLLLVFYWPRRKNDKASPASPLLGGLQQVSYDDIMKATDGFNSSNLIGSGSFGSVYKAVMGDEENTVAVKVFDLRRQGASKSFMVECETFRNIRHRNILKVLTVCASVDYQGNEFKALVYEFMVNGSLAEWLQPDPLFSSETIRHNLSFVQRLNIAFDVACAVEYLHHQCQTPVIHCDLKPSNVLLDVQMIGHVGDFGIARFSPEATTEVLISQATSIGVKGTIGYAPPEYAMGGAVSKEGDAYSYGVLLLELFTGKRSTDDMFTGNLNLHSYCKAALPGRVLAVADQALLSNIPEEGSRAGPVPNGVAPRRYGIRELLVMILEIGVACTAELPRERMVMADVETRLHSVKDKARHLEI